MLSKNKNSLTALGALMVATAVWGSTFFLTKGLLDQVSPFDMLGIRFALAAVVGLVVFFPWLRGASLETWGKGITLGITYAGAQMVQTWGLQYTDAAVSGFISAMAVVFTPVLVWVVFRSEISAATWLAVAVAVLGLGMLSLNGGALGIGEIATLIGAGGYAAHVVMLARWSQDADALALTGIQMISLGICCFLGALPGGIHGPSTLSAWAIILYLAVIAGLGCMALQTWAQARLSAEQAAITMTTEPLFGAAFAVLLGGELLTGRLLAGGGLIMLSMFISEIGAKIFGRTTTAQADADNREAAVVNRTETENVKVKRTVSNEDAAALLFRPRMAGI